VRGLVDLGIDHPEQTKMKKSALSLLSILALLPTVSYATPQELAVNLRSAAVGVQLFRDPAGFTLRDGVTVTDDSAAIGGSGPLAWSPKYGISGEDIAVSDLPGITGMWIDDITHPVAESVFFVGLYPGFSNIVGSESGSNVIVQNGVTITVGPGGPIEPNGIQAPKVTTDPDGTEREFVSFSQPVDGVFVAGYNGAFAIEGFTGSEPSKHVPDSGSTLMLLGFALVGLIAVKKRACSTARP
jgi:hypothetical protein